MTLIMHLAAKCVIAQIQSMVRQMLLLPQSSTVIGAHKERLPHLSRNSIAFEFHF